MQLYCNPLALSTMKSAWQDRESSFPTKIVNMATGALYDIYVKNPYNLTIGNCGKIRGSDQKIATCAVIAFASLYTLVLHGTTLHLQGRGLQLLASNTGIATLAKIADAAKVLGTQLFVAGAVPLYGLFYALPKKILLSLPTFTATVLTPALKTVTESLQTLMAETAKTTSFVFQQYILPLWNQAGTLLSDYVITPITPLTQKVYDAVIAPLVDGYNLLKANIPLFSKELQQVEPLLVNLQ